MYKGESKVLQCLVQARLLGVYIITKLVPAVVGSITVVDALTCCAFFHSMWFKSHTNKCATCLIQEFMLYKFKLIQNATESTKNICWAKGEGIVVYSIVNRWFKKFSLGCKDLNDWTKSGRSKAFDSEVILQTIKANPASSTQRI